MKRILRFAALGLMASLPSAALAAAPPQASGADAQRFAVLHAGHLVAAVESLTNAEAHCSVAVVAGVAGMQCRSAGGTAKASYHYHTALVLDDQGTAYVIACRVPLFPSWCKELAPGEIVVGTIANGLLSVAGGDKARQYRVLTSVPVGAITPPAPPVPKGAASKRQSLSASAPPPAAAAPKPAAPSADSSAACSSAAAACVNFVSEPSGADIYVDGKFAGNTPSTLALPPGSHELRVETARFKPWTRTLETTAASKITVRAALEAN
jgi:PEGA domain